MRNSEIIHGIVFSILSVIFVFFLHHLPVNQMFIDPFSEAIKSHDVMDIAISKFRDHKDPNLFDQQLIILNSEVTNRAEIASTIDYLLNHEVAGIGIDLVFDSLKNNNIDTLLANAIDSENVVLGYTFKEDASHKNESIIDLKSAPLFENKSDRGYVNIGSNDGFSVRTFEPLHVVDGTTMQSFSLKMASKLDNSIVKEITARNHKVEWINFKRIQPGKVNMMYPINQNRMVHYEYNSVTSFLRDTALYGDHYFKNKLILIGFCGENDAAMSMKDRYYTPMNEKYEGRSLPDMHGVVVHANIISMLLKRDFINEISEKYLYLISFFIFFMNYLLFSKIVRRKLFFMVPLVRIIQAMQFVILFAICIILLANFNIKVGFILIFTAMVLAFELFEFYHHKLRNNIAQKINKVFKKSNVFTD